METIRKIRVRHRRGESIRQISRDMRLSRNTVRKFVRKEEVSEHNYIRKNLHYPQLGGYIEDLRKILYEDIKNPKKRTSLSIFEALQSRGYQGSYSSVRRYVKRIREEYSCSNKKAYIPLSFAAGEAYQFDWSTQLVEIAGVPVKIKVAHFVLCYSRRKFTYAYPCETQEMLFDAHVRAFEYFGGVPRRGIYDNMKTAVRKVLRGKERDWNPAFERLCAHYMVEPVACSPASGWEKGQVERQVQIDRNRFFTPMQKVDSITSLNQILLSRVIHYNRTHKHPEDKSKTIEQVYEKELPNLGYVPIAFAGSRVKDVRVSSTCLAMFDRNHYSIDCTYAGKIVQCRAYADRLVFVYQGKEIARHERKFTRGQTYYHWQHYLPILIRKPGALRNGAPFANMSLPVELRIVQNHLTQTHPNGAKDFVQILSYIATTSIEEVQKACKTAIDHGTISANVILNTLLRSKEEPAEENTVDLPKHLLLQYNPTSDCHRYNKLLAEAA